jgi:hypothetical protein
MALRKQAVDMWPGCMGLNWDLFVGSGERGDGSLTSMTGRELRVRRLKKKVYAQFDKFAIVGIVNCHTCLSMNAVCFGYFIADVFPLHMHML